MSNGSTYRIQFCPNDVTYARLSCFLIAGASCTVIFGSGSSIPANLSGEEVFTGF